MESGAFGDHDVLAHLVVATSDTRHRCVCVFCSVWNSSIINRLVVGRFNFCVCSNCQLFGCYMCCSVVAEAEKNLKRLAGLV